MPLLVLSGGEKSNTGTCKVPTAPNLVSHRASFNNNNNQLDRSGEKDQGAFRSLSLVLNVLASVRHLNAFRSRTLRSDMLFPLLHSVTEECDVLVVI